MVTLLRLSRVLLVLVLALFTISFVIGIGSAETGAVEKVVLVTLIAACIFLAGQVSRLASRLQDRLVRH